MSKKEHLNRDDLDERNTESVIRELKVFLAITEDILSSDFKRLGVQYQYPKIAIADKHTLSKSFEQVARGGPGYYVDEQTIYIEPEFYTETLKMMVPDVRKATIAYNVFHEVGHHVQNLLGKSTVWVSKTVVVPVRLAKVALELQADCIAGMLCNIAHRVKPLFDAGDKENIMLSAWSLGDDVLSGLTVGEFGVNFMTHGTGAMRRDAVATGLTCVTLKQVPTVEWFIQYALQKTKTIPADWAQR